MTAAIGAARTTVLSVIGPAESNTPALIVKLAQLRRCVRVTNPLDMGNFSK